MSSEFSRLLRRDFLVRALHPLSGIERRSLRLPRANGAEPGTGPMGSGVATGCLGNSQWTANCSQCGYPGWRRQVGRGTGLGRGEAGGRTSWAERRSGPVQPGVGVRRSSSEAPAQVDWQHGWGGGRESVIGQKGLGEPSPK